MQAVRERSDELHKASESRLKAPRKNLKKLEKSS